MPIALAIVAIVAVVGIGAFLISTNNDTDGSSEVATPTRQEDTDSSSPNQTATPAPADNTTVVLSPQPEPVIVTPPLPIEKGGINGTFNASGNYLTPDRVSHEIDVTLTFVDGIVTDSDVVYDNGAGYSNANQERFDKAYQTEVIGKSLNDINLSQVGGASITSKTFNEAVAKIKAQV